MHGSYALGFEKRTLRIFNGFLSDSSLKCKLVFFRNIPFECLKLCILQRIPKFTFSTNFFFWKVIVQKTTALLLLFLKGLKYANKNEWYTLV